MGQNKKDWLERRPQVKIGLSSDGTTLKKRQREAARLAEEIDNEFPARKKQKIDDDHITEINSAARANSCSDSSEEEMLLWPIKENDVVMVDQSKQELELDLALKMQEIAVIQAKLVKLSKNEERLLSKDAEQVTDISVNNSQLEKEDTQVTTIVKKPFEEEFEKKEESFENRADFKVLTKDDILSRPDIYGESELDKNGIMELEMSYKDIGDELIGLVIKTHLDSNPDITKIDLTRSKLTAKGLKDILDTLRDYPGVSEIDLSNNNLFPEGANILADFFETNISFKSLDISYTKVDLATTEILFRALKSNTALKSLSLYGNSITDDIIEVIMSNLLDASITELNLGANKFTIEGAEYIAQSINQTKITKIFFTLCNLGNDTVTPILQALKDNDILKEVSLCDNNIGDSSAKLLANIIKNTKSLERLDISRNNITDVGAVAIGKALQSNDSIENLNLMSNCGISDLGIISIADAICVKGSRLSEIDMYSCNVGDNGAQYLVEALQVTDLSSRKIHIDLGCNRMTEGFLQRFLSNKDLNSLIDVDEPASELIGSIDYEYSSDDYSE